MKKTMVFKTDDDYEKWTDQFDGCYEYQEIPSVIDDGWRISADMFTSCKSWKTVLRRFEKAFGQVNPEIHTWVECIRESCESGYFKDTTGCYPAWTTDREEIREFLKGGSYSWEVEEVYGGYWYIFLNISGVYAGR